MKPGPYVAFIDMCCGFLVKMPVFGLHVSEIIINFAVSNVGNHLSVHIDYGILSLSVETVFRNRSWYMVNAALIFCF